jgi:phosphatidylserine/phosphatidylglycerophosphate/cardiolipin synthase-like enzyme
LPRRRIAWRFALAALAALWCGTAYWQAHKPMPPGTRIASPWYTVPAAQVGFIADTTAADAYGRPVVAQAIFDQMLAVVNAARDFIVLDYFLFNDERATARDAPVPIRALSRELRDALIERRRSVPQLRVLLITDPVNSPDGVPSNDFQMLRAAGVDIAVTDIGRLRDSSFLYSSLRRVTTGWWGRRGTRRSWLASLLDSANHRRTLIADDGHGGLIGIIGSADPHDASSTNSNVAAKVNGPALATLLASELTVARFSGWSGAAGPALGPPPAARATLDERSARIGIATESAVRNTLLEHLDGAAKDDAIDIAVSHLSDRAVIESLLAANARGVHVRLILDPNRSGAGDAVSSIPNGPVASELVTASDGAIHVRWYRTHGEEFHSKLVMVYGAARLWFTLGSADLTRRSLDGYDLTANIAIEVARGTPLALQMQDYFETLWSNRALLGVEYTSDFGVYADSSQSSYWLYRLMESTGLASF